MNIRCQKTPVNLHDPALSGSMIVGACIGAALADGWPDARIDCFFNDWRCGPVDRQDHALAVAKNYFQVSENLVELD